MTKANWSFPTCKQIDAGRQRLAPATARHSGRRQEHGQHPVRAVPRPGRRARQERRQDHGRQPGRGRLQRLPQRQQPPRQGRAAQERRTLGQGQPRRSTDRRPRRAGLRALPLGRGLCHLPGRPDEPGGLGQRGSRPSAAPPATTRTPTRMPSNCASSSKPVELPFEVKKDVGLSATCFECHNSRVNSADFEAGKSTSTPHYSCIAEMLSDTGGVTYGQTAPELAARHDGRRCAHPEPGLHDDPDAQPSSCSARPATAKGNIPGPCVTCHMWPDHHRRQRPEL